MKPKPVILKKGQPVPPELIRLALNWKLPTHSIPGGVMAAILEDSLIGLKKQRK